MRGEYIRKVFYHETDKMGIAHHANYIRWMEEARIDFLDKAGYGYAWLEDQGVISPVMGVECKYLRPCTFDDTVRVRVWVEEFKGVRLVIGYTMENQKTGEQIFNGKSSHCFTTPGGKPIILKRQFPELDRLLKELAEEKLK